MVSAILVNGKLSKCKIYNETRLTDVKFVEKIWKNILTFWTGGYIIILILYIDRTRGDV